MTPYVDIHTHWHTPDNRDGITIFSHRIGVGEQTPPYPYTAGIHPWDATDVVKDYTTLKTSNIIAVGEIGLDFSRSTDKSTQLTIFEDQLKIAEQRKLPVIIHCVKAFGELTATLKRYRLKAVIFHGYIGSPEQTIEITKAGYYISAGITSLNSSRTIDGLRHIPIDKLFLESDDSGKDIAEIYKVASEKFNIPITQLKETIYNNFKTIFIIS